MKVIAKLKKIFPGGHFMEPYHFDEWSSFCCKQALRLGKPVFYNIDSRIKNTYITHEFVTTLINEDKIRKQVQTKLLRQKIEKELRDKQKRLDKLEELEIKAQNRNIGVNFGEIMYKLEHERAKVNEIKQTIRKNYEDKIRETQGAIENRMTKIENYKKSLKNEKDPESRENLQLAIQSVKSGIKSLEDKIENFNTRILNEINELNDTYFEEEEEEEENEITKRNKKTKRKK